MTDDLLRGFSKSLPMALLKAREAVMQRFRPILNVHGITEQQWRVIRALYGTKGLEASELADRTLLLLPSLTRIINAMEEKGWVKKFTVDRDNRRRLIQISTKGTRLYQKIAPLSEEEYRCIEEVFQTDKLEALFSLLEELADLQNQTLVQE